MGEKKESPAPVPPTSSLEESERIFELLQAGIEPEKNLQRLHELNYRKVYTFFLRGGFLPEESRELTQEVFFRIFKHVPSSSRGNVQFSRWLFEVSGNIYRNELRRRHSEKRRGSEIPLDSSIDDVSSQDTEASSWHEADPLDKIIEQERRELLRTALRQLPPQMRRVCELRYVKELKYQEIANLMRISIETVKAHLHQARKRLLLELKEKSPEEQGLMSRIQLDFPGEAKVRYRDLVRKRDAGTLSPAEHQELIRLTDRLEVWQAERLEALADLAAFRRTTVDNLLQELSFKPLLDD